MRLLSTFLALAAASFAAAEPARPNVLYIMTDDHAAHAISCYGSKINSTPNLDRIAAGGVRFERCFVTNSICTPSRATVLTGKYSHLNGVPVFNRFDGAQPHLGKYMQAAGYHTGMIGKWHLGSVPTGFDYWNVLPGQGLYHNPNFFDAKGENKHTGYATDIITDMSIDFIKGTPKGKPFFLMCHHKAPHRSWEPDEKHRAMFADKVIPEPATLYDDYATRGSALKENRQRVFDDMTRRDLKLEPPANLVGQERQQWLNAKPKEVEIEVKGAKKILKGDELNKWKYQRYMQDYLACVQSVDDNVGRLLDFLKTSGLEQNTVVIYTSDQGFFLGDHDLFDKRFMYEQSLQMPLLIKYPGVGKVGAVEKRLAINPDFAPTILDMAGLPVPADMQGKSLLPLVKGEVPKEWRTSMYYRYYHDPGDHNTRAHYGVRTETHKLIYFWKIDQWEMYDLIHDPDEMKNIAGDPAHAALFEKMKAELSRVKKEMKDDDQFANEQPPMEVGGPPGAVPKKKGKN